MVQYLTMVESGKRKIPWNFTEKSVIDTDMQREYSPSLVIPKNYKPNDLASKLLSLKSWQENSKENSSCTIN